MPRNANELLATFHGFSQFWENDDGSATVIAVGECPTDLDEDQFPKQVKLKGQVTSHTDLTPGMTYLFSGRWETHERHGEQFWFEWFRDETPPTQEGIVAYLQQCDGIGPKTAEELWAAFGDKAVETLREDPDSVALKISRLKPDQVVAASELLKSKKTRERAKIELIGILHKCGVPKKVVDKALDEWGVMAAEMVKRNPYILMKFRGIGFLKTDKMYRDFGLPMGRLKRQALCCWYSIARNTDGDTWFPAAQARGGLNEQIGGVRPNFERALELAVRAKMLSVRTVGPQRWIAEYVRDQHEGRVARLIEAARGESEMLRAANALAWPDVDSLEAVSDHQREQLRLALRGVVVVLSGSPGSGKTFAAAQVIKSIIAKYGGHLVGACGPTGKSAVRLTESLDKIGVSLTATTIHAMLGVKKTGEGGWDFVHNERYPLPYKFVLLDESSMDDVALMGSVLAARGPGTHYLFLGDPNQLAPVGHGSPLRDFLLCPASVPAGELTEIQRNAGRGVRICAQIRDKKPWVFSPKLDLATGENAILVHQPEPEGQLAALDSLLRKFRDADPRKYDPVWDIQVICAVNKKGPLNRRDLNKRLQELLNPDGERADRSPFRVGDKLVNTKNGRVKSCAEPGTCDCVDDDGNVYVANGEQGKVIEVTTSRTVIELAAPYRLITVGRRAGSKEEEEAAEERSDRPEDDATEENSESPKTTTGCAWELGYAISAHKSQGADWPIIIILLDDHNAARRVCSRQWFFTSMSRFKEFSICIGTKEVADAMCRRDSLFKRKTFLRERIDEARAANEVMVAECADALDSIVCAIEDRGRRPSMEELLEGVF